MYGDGRQRRDWLAVADHCAAIEQVFLQGDPGQVYNVGGGNEPENITVAEQLFGWQPTVSFDAGLKETVEWYRRNESWWRPIKSGEFRAYYEEMYGKRLKEGTQG